MEQNLRQLQQILRTATSVTVLTGAGISAESGIPTFRKDGKPIPWRIYPDPTVLSHVDALDHDIREVWSWYGYRRRLIWQAEPNPGHVALAEWQQRLSAFTLITQNVDGLHQRAGSSNVVELHGNIWRAWCRGCGRAEYHTKDEVSENVPYCSCGSPLRPGVVMFGEALDPATIAAAQRATACDVFLAIGTSALVWPAAGLATEAKRRGAFLVEINPESTGLTDDVDLAIQGAAGEVLRRVVG